MLLALTKLADLIRGLQWPRVSWSYSALTSFENCELNYGAVTFRHTYPFETSGPLEAGKEAHKKLEDYISLGRPVPPGLVGITGVIDKMVVGAQQVTGEQSLNCTYDLKPCGWNHDHVSLRSKIDLTIQRSDNQSIIVDYKTSSEPREDFEQLELNALIHFLHNPEVKRCHCYYLYSKGFKPRKTIVDRDEVPKIVTSYIPRLQRLLTARETNTFRATPYYGCKWCPVITCHHNPKR